MDRLEPQIRELAHVMRGPVIQLREWPHDYTRQELLSQLLIDERAEDAT